MRSNLLSFRSWAHFDNYQHFDAYLDAVAALEIDPENVQALNARMCVAGEGGDLEQMQTHLKILIDRGIPDPNLKPELEKITAKLNLLKKFDPPRMSQSILVLSISFADTPLTNLNAIMSALFDGISISNEFVRAATVALLSRESTRKSPVRTLDVPRLNITGHLFGEFASLYKLFKLHGFPSRENPYLFNGNLNGIIPSLHAITTLIIAKAIDDDCVHFNQGPLYFFGI
jgi:hypothetical protein